MFDKLQFVVPCGSGFYRSIDKLRFIEHQSAVVATPTPAGLPGWGAPVRFAGALQMVESSFWNPGRLPGHHLPFAFALEQRAGVEEIGNFGLTVLRGGANQTKRDDGGVAILLNLDVFG